MIQSDKELFYPIPNEPDNPIRDLLGNAGLWFERFFDYSSTSESLYSDNNREAKEIWRLDDPRMKEEWIKLHFTKDKDKDKDKDTDQRMVGEQTKLNQYAKQQIGLVSSLKGEVITARLSSPLIIGMGNAHPLENGLAWHKTLGVPYISGAAVKGAVRAYIENHLEADEKEKKALLFQLFGSNYKFPTFVDEKGENKFHPDYESQAGEVIFFDALPIDSVQLGVEIMTPHVGKWYEQGGKIKAVNKESEAIPADWHDPVPVKYLAVDDAVFLFSFALRPTAKTSEVPLLSIKAILEAALAQAGLGAKTSSGYGRMKIPTYQITAENVVGYKWVNDYLSCSEKTLAERLGKQYNKTVGLAKDKGIEEDEFLRFVESQYLEQLITWADRDKKSVFGKAYKRITGKLGVEL